MKFDWAGYIEVHNRLTGHTDYFFKARRGNFEVLYRDKSFYMFGVPHGTSGLSAAKVNQFCADRYRAELISSK